MRDGIGVILKLLTEAIITMTTIMSPESILPINEIRKSNLQHQGKQVTYLEHPYRFVAFAIFTLLNVLGGTFMSAFTPLKDLIATVGLLGLPAVGQYLAYDRFVVLVR